MSEIHKAPLPWTTRDLLYSILVATGGVLEKAPMAWTENDLLYSLLNAGPGETAGEAPNPAPVPGTWTAGSIAFAGTDGRLTQDNAHLFWDDANNRLRVTEIRLGPNAHRIKDIGLNQILFESGTYAGTLVIDHQRRALILAGGDLQLSSEGLGRLQLGEDSDAPREQQIKSCDRLNIDGPGGDLILAGGLNRGASPGGSLIFQVAPPALPGVTGALVTRLTIDGTGHAAINKSLSIGRVDSLNVPLVVESLTTQQGWIRDLTQNEYCTLTVDPGGSVSFVVGKPADFLMFANQSIFSGKIIANSWQTDGPVGSIAPAIWKFGAKVDGAVTLDATKSLLMEVDGVLYKLAVVL